MSTLSQHLRLIPPMATAPNIFGTTGRDYDPQHGPILFRGHIAALDLMRGAAVLSVYLFHCYGATTNYMQWHGLAKAWIATSLLGHLGVHLFFVLSGFLITGIVLDSNGTPQQALRFWSRRARRILPAYLLLLVALRVAHVADWHFVLACLLFVPNLGRLVGTQIGIYATVWTLAVEEQFYLVWPWLVWHTSRKTVRRTIVAALILSPCIRLGLSIYGQDTYFKTYANVDYLMYGALIALTLRTGQLHSGNIRRVKRWLYAGGFAGIGVSVFLLLLYGHNPPWVGALFDSIGRIPYMALFTALLLGAVEAHHRTACRAEPRLEKRRPSIFRNYASRGLEFCGYISYGLYLVHMLIFRFYDALVAGTWLGSYQSSFGALTLRAILVFAPSVAIAWLSRATIEAWFLRRNRSQRAPALGSSGAA